MAQEHGAGRAKPAEVAEEYRAIFEATTDGLIINDLATGRIVEVNPALCRMHGYRREELIGSLPTKFIQTTTRCSPTSPIPSSTGTSSGRDAAM